MNLLDQDFSEINTISSASWGFWLFGKSFCAYSALKEHRDIMERSLWVPAGFINDSISVGVLIDKVFFRIKSPADSGFWRVSTTI
jgi:hypothetical protein